MSASIAFTVASARVLICIWNGATRVQFELTLPPTE